MTEATTVQKADTHALAQSFEPAINGAFDERRWQGQAQRNVIMERCILEVMRMDDKQLFAKTAASDESVEAMLNLVDACDELAEHYESGIEMLQAAKSRMLIVLARLKIEWEGETEKR